MAIVSDPQVDPDSASPNTSANSAPVDNVVNMLEDIPLDNAPVTLSPFTREHFNLWKFQIQCIFRSRDLLDIAEGTERYNPNAELRVRRY